MAEGRKQVTFYCDVNLWNNFNLKYPKILPHFLRLCLFNAIQDKDFFDKILFETDTEGKQL